MHLFSVNDELSKIFHTLYSISFQTYCKMCGFDVPMKNCQGNWNGNNLPVLTLAETEEYLTTPQNIIGYLVHKVGKLNKSF